jgi:hypothetical protein
VDLKDADRRTNFKNLYGIEFENLRNKLRDHCRWSIEVLQTSEKLVFFVDFKEVDRRTNLKNL